MPFLVPFAGLVATLRATPVQRPDADPKPHIIFFLQDDLGRYNVAFNADRTDMPSVDVASVSPQISMLAKQGIILDRHYVHWHCSPTRRSLLTGRTPLHHGEALSGITTDDIDLRWSTIGQKLEGVGYKSHWYGKGHTGYKSMNHLPDRIGFSSGHLGFLSGAMNYHGEQRWRDEQPYHTAEYSTKLYGDAAVAALEAHDPNAAPLFMYLPWQVDASTIQHAQLASSSDRRAVTRGVCVGKAVHEPYTAPPGYNASAQSCDGAGAQACVLYAMLGVADTYVGRITTLLRSKGMWDSTLVVYSADK
jgi:arylsulfatase B